MKMLWLSRHPMTEDQLKDLQVKVDDTVEVEMSNITWQASDDANKDQDANFEVWKKLVNDSPEQDVYIAGVFPPVALEALLLDDAPFTDQDPQKIKTLTLLSPVSRQDKKVREDGNAQIEFVHLRWAEVDHGWCNRFVDEI